MSVTDQGAQLDEGKLQDFVFRVVGEIGATLNTALVVMGDKLGLYRAMAGAGPLTPGELAERTGTAERYVREWLNAQAAGDFVSYAGLSRSPRPTAPHTCRGSSRSLSARCSTHPKSWTWPAVEPDSAGAST
jgi:hypothetical protein